jgi:uncharacterized protein
MAKAKLGDSFSSLEARRIALAAQGFAKPPRAAKPTVTALREVARRVLIFQVDPINVVVRSHYLPAYSRLGPYDPDLLERLLFQEHGLFEYVGHEWSLVAIEQQPHLRWRMKAFHDDKRWLHGMPKGYTDHVLAQVTEKGPLTPAELDAPGQRGGRFEAMPGKRALHWLTQSGVVAVAGRRNNAQVYDLADRVIPKEILDVPTPDRDDARRALLLASAKALGIATAKDIVSYFLLGMGVAGASERVVYPKIPTAAKLVAELAADGHLREVAVEGWAAKAYLHPDAELPAAVDVRTLLSPFDSLLWERERTERLFDFRYRIEIYTPAPKREFGYYVLPLMVGESLVGRFDLKADRARGVLCVPGAYLESNVKPVDVAAHAACELRRLAGWLGLESVEVGERGNFVEALRAEVGHG